MDICLVGLNNKRVEQIAYNLANDLGIKFVNLATEFDHFLLCTVGLPAAKTEKLLQKSETKLVVAAQDGNSVIFIPNDMFLSNQNYKKINSIKIAITDRYKNEIKTNLQNLICKNCDYNFLDNADILNQIKEKIC